MDPSCDHHFLHRVLGKTVHITLKCGTFQGILQHVDSSQCIFLNRGIAAFLKNSVHLY